MKRKVLNPDAITETGPQRNLTESQWYTRGFRNGTQVFGVLGLVVGFALGLLAAMAVTP